MVITNCIIRDNLSEDTSWREEFIYNRRTTASFSCMVSPPWQLQELGLRTVGLMDVDPCFVDPGRWDQNGTPDDPNDDFWVEGDYHLKSQAGHWDAKSKSWVTDSMTSPCIDTGDPNSPIGDEPFPNGRRIDMGAYGGTAEASKSPSGLHARYGGGAGEPNDPYLIYTAEQMNALGARPDDWESHFRLMADIDLGSGAGAEPHTIGYWRGWQDSKPFRGTFDGNGHRILHFTWRSTGQDRIGLFGFVAGTSSYLTPTATIKDLGLIEPDIDAGTGDDVGALVGYFSSAAIWGCYVEGGRVSGGKHVGGLVGGTINSIMLSSIPRLDIRNCHATATVSGTEAVGGLIGYYGGVTWRPTAPFKSYYEISNCCTAGEVSGTAQVGGLAGFVDGGHVFDCYSRSRVSGDHLVGGLIGISHAETATCYSAGKVEGTADVGGLIGSVAAGDVIPEIEEPVRTSNSFWDVQASGQTISAGGGGKTTAEMQTARTFLDAGWDFIGETTNGTADLWQIREGRDYPQLSWEAVVGQETNAD